ncbi:hypothetical protein MJK70_07405 [Klebsiella pneumoniae]|nr:hypothetical protein MJK70_07405 [Klebsiella pneumoniae]
MLVAVVLTAAATALAGPISFIAFSRATHCPPHQWHRSPWGLTQAALLRGVIHCWR